MNILYSVRDIVNRNILKDENMLKNKEFLKEQLRSIGGERLVGNIAIVPLANINSEVSGWALFWLRTAFDKDFSVCVNYRTREIEKYSFIKHMLRKYR